MICVAGRTRLKSQTSWPDHPETSQAAEDSIINARHLEPFWSALRRTCSAFQRHTNYLRHIEMRASTHLTRVLGDAQSASAYGLIFQKFIVKGLTTGVVKA